MFGQVIGTLQVLAEWLLYNKSCPVITIETILYQDHIGYSSIMEETKLCILLYLNWGQYYQQSSMWPWPLYLKGVISTLVL